MAYKIELEIGATALTLAGVFVGVYGTYKMTKYYHPYRWVDFIRSILTTMYRDVTGQHEKADLHNRVAARVAGSGGGEDKSISLRGVEWVFVGFLLQTVGAVLALIDVLANS